MAPALPPPPGPIGRGLDLLFPRGCVGCDGLPARPFRHLCGDCARALPRIAGEGCPRCGAPRPRHAAAGTSCLGCLGIDRAFSAARCLLHHRGAARALVTALKYHAAMHLLSDIDVLLAIEPGLGAWLGPAVLVPVPLHPRRLRERGYNQGERIARRVEAAYPSCTVREVLRRPLDTPSQTRLNRALRLRNVQNAFATADRVCLDAARPHVLVDDVLTTGATLDACARVLRDAGLPTVRVLTLAHG